MGQALLGLAEHPNLLHSRQLHDALEEIAQALRPALEPRRRLALYLAQHGSGEAFLGLLSGLPNGSLVSPDDLVHWMEHWDQFSAVHERIAQIFVSFPRPQDTADLLRWEAARHTQPALRQATAGADMPPAELPWAKEDRELAATERQRNTYDQADLKAALDAVLAAGPEQVRQRWGQVLFQLDRTADGTSYYNTEPVLSCAITAPSYPRAGSDLANLLECSARHVLRTVPALDVDILVSGAFESLPFPELSAFALLDGLTGVEVSPAHWAGWAVAIACADIRTPAAQEVQRTALPLCTQQAQGQLASLLTTVLAAVHEQDVRRVAQAYAALQDHATSSVLLAWAAEPERRPEQWLEVVGELAASDNNAQAVALLTAVLDDDPAPLAPHSTNRVRWVLAARLLLHLDCLPQLWPIVRPRLEDGAVLTEFMQMLARMPAPLGSWPTALGSLTEQDLAELYGLFVDHLGTAVAAGPSFRSGFISDEDRLGDLVRSLPDLLASRNTVQAASRLQALAERYPEVWQLRLRATTTMRTAAARNAMPLEPEALLQLAEQQHLRLLRDQGQLLGLVTESLRKMERELQGYNGTAVNLWNRDNHTFGSTTKCWPCWEDDLCDAVTAFLRRDIGGKRVVVSREVEVRRPGLPGLRTDIHIEVPASDDGQNAVRVIIECKGCWNRELPDAIEKQLTTYLTEPNTAGLLLVGYFNCTRWNTDRRTCPARNHDIDDIRQTQLAAAAQANVDPLISVSAYVLDCRLPGEVRFPRDAGRGDSRSDGSHERNPDHGCSEEVPAGVAGACGTDVPDLRPQTRDPAHGRGARCAP